jgi:hypothetical protein
MSDLRTEKEIREDQVEAFRDEFFETPENQRKRVRMEDDYVKLAKSILLNDDK